MKVNPLVEEISKRAGITRQAAFQRVYCSKNPDLYRPNRKLAERANQLAKANSKNQPVMTVGAVAKVLKLTKVEVFIKIIAREFPFVRLSKRRYGIPCAFVARLLTKHGTPTAQQYSSHP